MTVSIGSPVYHPTLNKLRNQHLFIVDEASMKSSHALHGIDRCLQDITGTKEIFVGYLLLGGDFRHVPLLYLIEHKICVLGKMKKNFHDGFLN